MSRDGNPFAGLNPPDVATQVVFQLADPDRSHASIIATCGHMRQGPAPLVSGLVCALAMGLVGGLLPAVRAARLPVRAGAARTLTLSRPPDRESPRRPRAFRRENA
jgi:hypothetical protein